MPTYFTPLILPLLILLTPAYALAQEEAEQPELDAIAQLMNRLYTVEGFQGRFGNALESNADFRNNVQDRVFMNSLSASAKENALLTYSTAIREVLEGFTPEEIEAMGQALDSPAGPALVRLFGADQITVTLQLRNYVSRIVEAGLAAMVSRDSLLYAWESSHDLREIMDGEYVDYRTPGEAYVVRRDGNRQTESIGEADFRFGIEWLSNNQYSIFDLADNPVKRGADLTATIYEIEGPAFRYIWKNPDGTYGKNELVKTTYTSYDQELNTFRWGLTEQYRNPGTSPLPEAERLAFAAGAGHEFFPTDESLRITAEFVPDTTGAEFTMPTSSGSSVTYAVYGKAYFTLGGGAQVLTLFQQLDPDPDTRPMLFLPFRDATSGTSTYGGGRYLDLTLPEDGTLILDFNKAYHPYCAYADGYACPVPPAENQLTVPVEAGIRLSDGEHGE